MAADECKNEEACKLADAFKVKATGRSMREEMSKFKERTEELRKQKVEERGKAHKLFVFDEDEEGMKSADDRNVSEERIR